MGIKGVRGVYPSNTKVNTIVNATMNAKMATLRDGWGTAIMSPPDPRSPVTAQDLGMVQPEPIPMSEAAPFVSGTKRKREPEQEETKDRQPTTPAVEPRP
jgi:hypothetical protein